MTFARVTVSNNSFRNLINFYLSPLQIYDYDSKDLITSFWKILQSTLPTILCIHFSTQLIAMTNTEKCVPFSFIAAEVNLTMTLKIISHLILKYS